MSEILKLSDIKPGEYAKVLKTGGEGALRQHLLDMGLTPGAALEVIKYAPMGDPLELRIHGYELTLRLSEAECIRVEKKEQSERNVRTGVYKDIEHPGLGEYGKTHDKSTENPLPKTSRITFALAGNQNSGKTTLFNALTGSNQHVGNFPGVTVDRKDGTIQGHPETRITDLPGI